MGRKPLTEVTAPQLLAMAKRIESRGAVDIAKRALQTCGQILRYAVAHGLLERNPAADVKPSDALKPRRKENYARLDAKEVPQLLRKIDAYQGTPTTWLEMALMALTVVRIGELIGARWREFDLAAAEWRIPAVRMKRRTQHIVPLSTPAIEVLATLNEQRRGVTDLLFPGERDHEKPMSNNTILKALERMGYKGRMTGHGFRGIASNNPARVGLPARCDRAVVGTPGTQRGQRRVQPRDLPEGAEGADAGLGGSPGSTAQRDAGHSAPLSLCVVFNVSETFEHSGHMRTKSRIGPLRSCLTILVQRANRNP